MGIKKLIMILASLSFTVSALAEDMGGEKKPFKISGDFAGSLHFYDNEYNNSYPNTTGGANQGNFNVDLAKLDIEKNWSKSNLHLSVGYGTTASFVNAANATSTLNLLDAYYHLDSSYGLGFTFGKFESPVGHERYVQMDNPQYTRSYGFQFAPYFSTGAWVDYGQDMWKVGLIVSNGSGKTTDTGDKNKTMGLIVDVDPMENLHVDVNYVTGTEGNNSSTIATITDFKVNIMDVSVAYMINEMFDVAVNYISNSQESTVPGSSSKSATSMAAYVNANLGMFGLGLRYEQFAYDYGIMAYNGLQASNNLSTMLASGSGNDNKVSALTLAAKAEIDQNAVALLEYRMDSSDDKVWNDKDGNATDAVSTITAAVMYRF